MNRILLFVAGAGLALGCHGKEPEAATGAIVLQLSAASPGAITAGRDTILLRRARIVLAELAIAPSLANECEEEEGEDNPPCVEFDEHPVVIDLPLDLPSRRRSAKPAPATSFNLFQAVIHRPTPAADTALLRANPEFDGKSVLVEGVWSHGGVRTPFAVGSDFSEQEEISLEPALSVPKSDSLRITLRVDVASWFRSADGKALVDPRTAGPGGPNEHLLRDHIRTSIAVFRDQDGDGRADAPTP